MESETINGKVERLNSLKEQLEDLRVKSYQPPVTMDHEDPRFTSPEYEFEDAYSEPELAIALFIEIAQLKHEIVSGKRIPIISQALADELRFPKSEVNPRRGHLEQRRVFPRRASIIEIRF